MRAAGLPIGLQLMGQAWAEARLLSAGAVLEAAVRSRVHPPPILYGILERDQGLLPFAHAKNS